MGLDLWAIDFVCLEAHNFVPKCPGTFKHGKGKIFKFWKLLNLFGFDIKAWNYGEDSCHESLSLPSPL